jgi:serpin B
MKKHLLLPLAALVAAALLTTVCPADDTGRREQSPADAVIRGNNQFALDLYGRLRAGEGNLFFSPYSVRTALAMTYTGARGQTATDMAKALHFSGDGKRVSRDFGSLIRQLHGGDRERSYSLEVANSLWYRQGDVARAAFTRRLRNQFQAEVRKADFRGDPEEAAQAINRWVKRKTHGKITDLIQPGVLNANTRLVLANAIYFKARWLAEFVERATQREAFHLSAAKTVTGVPLMHQTNEYRYLDGGTFQLLELPYERGELAMVVLLPKKVDGLVSLEKALTAERLEAWRARAKPYEVQVTLPKFKVTAGFTLEQDLAALGMAEAFSPRKADFSGIGRQRQLFIARVDHKAYVAVNEQGTEAAAATAVQAADAEEADQPKRKKATFRADHPFLFLIRHRATGGILFLGRLVNAQ